MRVPLVVAGLVAAAASVAYLRLRPAGCDGKVHERIELSPSGEGEHAVTHDGCLRVRYATRDGARVGLMIFDVLPDGDERPRLVLSHAPGAALAPPSLDLPPLPTHWVPNDLERLTWYRYSAEGQPLERVERTYENRGQLIQEQRSSYEGGRWVAATPRTIRLDLAPDRFPSALPNREN